MVVKPRGLAPKSNVGYLMELQAYLYTAFPHALPQTKI